MWFNSIFQKKRGKKVGYIHTCLGSFAFLMMQNAYVLEGGNEGGRKATPTSISIFDFLWYKGHVI